MRWLAAVIVVSCGYPEPTHLGDGGTMGSGDGAPGTWGSAASLPVARAELAASLDAMDYLYVFGGYSSPDSQTDTAFWTNISTPSGGWNVGSAMPTARYGLAAAVDSEFRVYAIGGATLAAEDLATVEVFTDISTTVPPSWTTMPSLATSRYSLAAIGGPDGRVYAIGGMHEGKAIASVEAFPLEGSAWTAVPAMPTPRAGLAAVSGSDRIYAIGGGDEVNGPSSAVESYTPATNTWQTCAPLPTPRSGLAAALGSDGRIYAIGGRNAQQQILATVKVYDPTSNTWTTVASLPDGRADAAAVLGPDRRIYVIGGTDPNFIAETAVEWLVP